MEGSRQDLVRASPGWWPWSDFPGMVAVSGGAALLVAAGVPAFFAAVLALTAAIGWALLRFTTASRPGVLLWIAAAMILCIELLAARSDWLALAGWLLLLPAGVAFLAASRNRQRCAANCAGCMIVVFSLLIPAVSFCTMRDCRAKPDAVQETRLLIQSLHRLSLEIEEYRVRLGRLPKDESELVALRGRPMPAYHGDFRVKYHPDGGKYRLDSGPCHFWGEHGDFFGWMFCFYGPDSVQRLHVESF